MRSLVLSISTEVEMVRYLKLKIETCKCINFLWNHILYQRFLVWNQSSLLENAQNQIYVLLYAGIVNVDSGEVTDGDLGWL